MNNNGFLKRRFHHLTWSLDNLAQSRELREDSFYIRPDAKKTRYPVAALRYWWACAAMAEEAAGLGRVPVIVDVGCERGQLRRFAGTRPDARWIGLDFNHEHPALISANYDELHHCDLDRGLPLPDGSADIFVCLHVFEHLTDPDSTLKEMVRVVRPGGILLIGVPIAPHPVAIFQGWLYDRGRKAGRIRARGHIQSFSPHRWKKMAGENKLEVDSMAGSHFFRLTGKFPENYALWIRLNQLWGALFPSLGSELYFQLRKPFRSAEYR